jgi:PAS domain S-box-containing protein
MQRRSGQSPARRYRVLFERSAVGVFRSDLSGRVLDCNPALALIVGEEAGAVLGRRATDFCWSASDRDALLRQLVRDGFVNGAEMRLRRADGRAVWALVSVHLAEGEPDVIEGMVLDVSDRKRAEVRIVQLNRLHAVLSHVGQSIVRNAEREALLADVCRIAVQHGGFLMAWFGVPDESGRLIVPVARHGHEDGHPACVRLPVSASDGNAQCVCNDLSDSRDGAWREEAVRRGYGSCAAFPVNVRNRLAGILGLCAAEPGFFDHQTVGLLRVVAGDLAFALESMEREADRRRSEQERARLYLSEQAARARARADARFRDLLEAAPDAILECDAAGRILVANPAAERLFGYSREELLAARIEDLVPERFRCAHAAHVSSYFAEPRRQAIDVGRDLTARRKDGAEFPVEISLSPVQAEQGGLVTCIVRDVTARKRGEDALRESDRRIRSILESITDGFFAVDREWRFTYLNGRAEQIVGRTRDELLGRCLWDEFPALAGTAFEQDLRRADAAQQALEFSAPYAPLKLWLDVHVYPSENGLSVYFQDITTRTLLAEQSGQSQRLEALGRLAGEVAHDFNNLLTIIGGYSEMILESAGKNQTALRRDAGIVVEAAGRASALTRQLLAFSRRQVVQPKVLDLNRLISKMSKMLQRMMREDIELRLTLRAEPARISADPGQIEQVVMNLAVNARDAMPQGGALSIATASREVAGETETAPRLAPGSYVVLTVTDTGTGLTEEARSHLFEPFFTTKPRGKGTGLGLAAVYGIIKQSGGEIWVDSEPGKGARFEAYFPRATKTPQSKSAASAASRGRRRGNETILLVEDETEVRKLARGMLARLGYNVLEAAGPAEALAIWQTAHHSVDLLLTDVIMPQMSGRELAERLVESRPGLKVLYMTGYTEEVIRQRGVQAGKAALLQKPFSREALGARVRAILDSTPPDPAGPRPGDAEA